MMAIEEREFASKVLFVRERESRYSLRNLEEAAPNSVITETDFDTFLAADYELDPTIEHVVVSGSLENIKATIEIVLQAGLGLGILPRKQQVQLGRYLGLSTKGMDPVMLALQKNRETVDVIRCNGHIILFSAVIGRVLLGQGEDGYSRLSLVRHFFRNLHQIRLLGFKFQLQNRKLIDTAACGCTVVTTHATNRIFRSIADQDSSRDGRFSLMIAAPLSIMGYLGFMYRMFKGEISVNRLPDTFGYIKTDQVAIRSDEALKIKIDGYSLSETPADIRVQPLALRVNRAPEARTPADTGERVDVGNLPMGSEKAKAMKKKLPFFPYATEERFKDLFIMLRQDSSFSPAYIVLMVLSTMLATVGLFQDSASVIIGAMLLAPLMAPIVSLAMGLLRSDSTLYYRSAKTIAGGVLIALGASALIAQTLPYELVTPQMSARLNPTLLDLAVAILAGVAAAYTKSNKDMLSGLAGVAIAVALVPPLAVSGVGLGRLDPVFFGQAFLLFSTNLVGILVSAALVFRILGYSPAIKARKNFFYVVLTLAIISFPLYFSYDQIVQNLAMDQAWKRERYLVNGKYLIVRETKRYQQRNRDVVEMQIFARESLTRDDMDAFKAKIRKSYERDLLIRTRFTYIL